MDPFTAMMMALMTQMAGQAAGQAIPAATRSMGIGGEQEPTQQPAQQPSATLDEAGLQATTGQQPGMDVGGLMSEVGGLLGGLAAGTAPDQDSWQFRLGALVAQQAQTRMQQEQNKLEMQQLFQQNVMAQQGTQQAAQEMNQPQPVQPGQAQTPGPQEQAGAAQQGSSLAGISPLFNGMGNFSNVLSAFSPNQNPMRNDEILRHTYGGTQ